MMSASKQSSVRHVATWLAPIILLACVSSFGLGIRSMSLREAHIWCQANGNLPESVGISMLDNPPYGWFLHAWSTLFGDSERALRFSSLLCILKLSVITAGFSAKVLRHEPWHSVGLCGLLLVATSPIHFQHSRFVGELPLASLLAIAGSLALASNRGNWRRLSTICYLFCRIIGPAISPWLVATILWDLAYVHRVDELRKSRLMVLVGSLGGLCWLGRICRLDASGSIIAAHLSLKSWESSLLAPLRIFLLSSHPVEGWWLAGLVLFFFIMGYRAVRSQPFCMNMYSLGMLLTFFGLFAVIRAYEIPNLSEDEVLLPALPFGYVFLLQVSHAIGNRPWSHTSHVRAFIIALGLVRSSVTAVEMYMTPQGGLRQASEIVTQERQPDDILFACGVHAYFPAKYYGLNPELADVSVDGRIVEANRVWLLRIDGKDLGNLASDFKTLQVWEYVEQLPMTGNGGMIPTTVLLELTSL